MDNLNVILNDVFGVNVSNDFVQKAVYSPSMDCVEYTSTDTITISDRVDEFLTIIVDARDRNNIVGFKIKGFRHFFETELKEKHDFKEADFIPLVCVLEEIFTHIGDDLANNGASSKRQEAYQSAKCLAERDNVKIDPFPMAA